MKIGFVLLLFMATTVHAARDPQKCGHALVGHATKALSSGIAMNLPLPKDCPVFTLPKGYQAFSPRAGVQILWGPAGPLAFFIDPPKSKTHDVTRIVRVPGQSHCPAAPPGYRLVYAFVPEGTN